MGVPAFFARYEEAMALVEGLPKSEIALKQFVLRAVTAATMRFGRSLSPMEGSFDMVFFVETMIDLFAQRENLKRIFAGEDLRWWSDED